MTDWSSVQKRAKEEKAFAKEVASKGAGQIESYYPELHSLPGGRSFTNTLGSYLIPDLLTSECVVVDVYDWSTPESLIDVYGVDLDFLLALRDADLVKICANLPVERYEKHSWLFPILADKRTIYRSIRTPAFFAKRDPEFDVRRATREKDFRKYFASLPSDQLRRLCSAVTSAHPPKDASALASVLSQWLERLVAIDAEIAAEICDRFELRVIESTPELMRLQRLMVSPHSAYLGGKMKIERNRWASLFGEESIEDAIVDGQVRLQKLNAYFSEVVLKLDETDLTNAQQWHSMRSTERKKLLDDLGDTQKKADILAAEEELRVGLAFGGDRDPSRESIRTYVERLESQAKSVWRVRDTLSIAAPVVFGLLSESVVVGLTVAGGLFSSKYWFGERIRHFTESVIGKLRVVRILGKRDE